MILNCVLFITTNRHILTFFMAVLFLALHSLTRWTQIG